MVGIGPDTEGEGVDGASTAGDWTGGGGGACSVGGAEAVAAAASAKQKKKFQLLSEQDIAIY